MIDLQHTFDADYGRPYRLNESVDVTDDVEAIDLLLPHTVPSYDPREDLQFFTAFPKTLRVNRIDDRSLVLSDLSHVPDDHAFDPPALGAEYDAPFMPIDLFPGETTVVGRDSNPFELPILGNRLISRRHFGITAQLGERGLKLAFRDLSSRNGTSPLTVHRRQLTRV